VRYESIRDNLGYLIAGVVIFSVIITVVFELRFAPQVKKSSFGVCHHFESFYYQQTTNYTSYMSMQECVDSGGREP